MPHAPGVTLRRSHITGATAKDHSLHLIIRPHQDTPGHPQLREMLTSTSYSALRVRRDSGRQSCPR